MHELVLAAGVDPEKVFRIPIGVDLEHFPLRDDGDRAAARDGARHSGVGVRRRLVPQGRRRARRRARAEARQGAGHARRGARRGCASAIPELFVLLTGPARGYVRRELESLGIPLPPRAARLAGRAWPAPTTRSTLRSSRRGRRAGRRPCSSRWRPAFRSSRPASARRRSSSWTVRTACSPTSTTSTRSRPRSRASTTTRSSPRTLGERGRPTAEANADERLDGRWAQLLDGFVVRKRRCGLTARASAATLRAALALGAPARAEPAEAGGPARVLRPRPRAGGRESRSRAGRRSSSGSRRASRTVRPTSRCSTSGSTWLPRDLDPLLRLARRRRIPVVVNQDGVAYPGWAGEATEELNRRYRRALLAADHVLYQSRVQQGVVRSLPRGAARARGRSSTTPSTSSASRLRSGRRAAGRCSCSAATRRRRTGSSSALRTFAARSRGRARGAAARHRPARLDPRSRCSTSSACATASSSSAGMRSATRPSSCAARISCCTRRSRTRARAR